MIRFIKSDKNAITPYKERQSDSGFDLTLIKKIKNIGNVELYDTGIKVQIDKGYYLDLVPRSSIIKSGYIMANSIGIIDFEYTGNIKVPLIKVDKNKPDLILPMRLVQLIPRKIEHFDLVEVKSFEKTDRNDNGFGSTNNKK